MSKLRTRAPPSTVMGILYRDGELSYDFKIGDKA